MTNQSRVYHSPLSGRFSWKPHKWHGKICHASNEWWRKRWIQSYIHQRCHGLFGCGSFYWGFVWCLQPQQAWGPVWSEHMLLYGDMERGERFMRIRVSKWGEEKSFYLFEVLLHDKTNEVLWVFDIRPFLHTTLFLCLCRKFALERLNGWRKRIIHKWLSRRILWWINYWRVRQRRQFIKAVGPVSSRSYSVSVYLVTMGIASSGQLTIARRDSLKKIRYACMSCL